MATLSLDSAELKIYIFSSGDKPPTPNYTLAKTKLAGEDTINFEISELIKDYVDVTFDGDYGTAITTKIVETSLTRTFKGTVDNTEFSVSDPSPLEKTFIAFRGYGSNFDINTYNTANNNYFGTNVNPTLSRDILISNRKIYSPKGEDVNIPLFTDVGGVHKVDFLDGTTVTTTKVVGGNVSDITADKDNIRADNSTGALQVFTADMTLLRSEDASGASRIQSTTTTTTGVNYTNTLGADRTIPIIEIEECKYTPFKITFCNAFGALQDLWFFKKRTDEFSVEREDYNKTILTTNSTGVAFNPNHHQSNLLDVSANRSFKMNTGFISEDHNQVINQLMVTEFCWLTDEQVIPVKPITSSMVKKTELNDKLINFEVEFEYANSYIQNVR
jgi:hypothetical protein